MNESELVPMVIQPPPFTGPLPVHGLDHGLPEPTSSAAEASERDLRSVIGVDVGGSGIKAASVDPVTGSLTSERVRITTPTPATPDAVVGTIVEVVERVMGRDGATHLDDGAPVGLTLPAVVRSGTVSTAANIDPGWIGVDAVDVIGGALHRPVVVVNDADAAGVAEMRVGAGRGDDGRAVAGVVLMLTLGTGIGSALFVDGTLVPNTELGHLPLRGGDAERYAASSVRKAEGLSMKRYAERLQEYLELVERLLWPDLILIGGGISKRADEFLPLIELRTPLRPARLRNQAGIVGAALLAADDDSRSIAG
ncbi:MAG TPA: ROK family protein [Microthrixaceae bacterium]|nr:ROK family protein [Microthrixaceae bacterium]HNJ69097.1 ROK family protein [Microthrixaceae bacterium]HNK39466.1 ROK family protein [Microthrixaceae bacterium]HNO46911.1 ROK family protein [Microthrixaceae bacterium]